MKYNLPPNDPRFLSMTSDDIEAEYWAYYYHERGDNSEFESDDFDEDGMIADGFDFSEWEDVINDHAE